MKYRNFNYNPHLYEEFRDTLLNSDINLIVYPSRKMKKLICTKIDLIPGGEIAVLCIIPLTTYDYHI